MSKEATVVLLDISPSMSKTTDGFAPLELAIKHAKTLITQKIVDARASASLAIVHLNSPNTRNSLASETEYLGIDIVKGLFSVAYEHFEAVQVDSKLSSKSKSTTSGLECPSYFGSTFIPASGQELGVFTSDYLDSIVVAADLIITLTEGKAYGEKRIVLITDLGNSKKINDSGLDVIVGQLQSAKITLDLVLVDSIETKVQNLRFMQQLVMDLKGKSFEINRETQFLVKSKRVRQVAAFKSDLKIADDAFQIPVNVYAKTMAGKLLITSKIFLDKHQNQLDSLESHPVGKERKDLTKVYKYGKTLVPLTAEDEQAFSLKSTKDFSIIGFVSINELPRHYFMGNTYVVCGAGDSGSLKMKTLVKALRNTHSGIIGRQVFRDGAAPRLVALLPHIEDFVDTLLMSQLPFAENVRRFSFSSLNMNILPPQFCPNEQQSEAMDSWVESMIFSKDEIDFSKIPNPEFQRQVQCVLHRLGHPEEPILSSESPLMKVFKTPQKVAKSSNLDALKSAFPVHATTKEDNVEMIKPYSIPEDIAKVTFAVQNDTFEPKPEPIRKIRREAILEDFESMTTNSYHDLVLPAMLQLMLFITELAHTEVETAFESMKKLRETAVKEDEIDRFNWFLRDLKRQRHGLHANFPIELWERIKAANLTLISTDDNCEEVARFFE